MRDAGREPLEVPRRYEGRPFRGLWNCARLIAGRLGEGPKAGEWDGTSCMREEAEASIRPAKGPQRAQWSAASITARTPLVLRWLTSPAVKEP